MSGFSSSWGDAAGNTPVTHRDLLDDTVIAETIARIFDWTVSVPRGSVKATVSKGWVTLHGKVDWGYQSEAASTLVRDLIGVIGVSNLLVVKAPVRGTDVKDRITDALYRHAQIVARRIWLAVDGGHVVLHGQVSSWSEAEAARQAAEAAPGVTEVESRLVIAP